MNKICGDSVKEAQQTLLFAGSGSNPTSPHHLKIYEGKFRDFAHILDEYHYKGKKIGGSISWNLVLKYEGRVYGGIVIGVMRHKDKYSKKAVELRRMVLSPECPKNTASYFLSKTIWWLKNNTDIEEVWTFADLTVNHEGTCYKAANFDFVRETPRTMHILWNGKRYHPRSLTIERPYSYRLREAILTGEAKKELGKPKKLYKYTIKRKTLNISFPRNKIR